MKRSRRDRDWLVFDVCVAIAFWGSIAAVFAVVALGAAAYFRLV